jgi:hypothetical protein
MFQNGAHTIVRDLETRADEVLFDVAPGDRVADWSQDGASEANETQAQLAPNGKWIALERRTPGTSQES